MKLLLQSGFALLDSLRSQDLVALSDFAVLWKCHVPQESTQAQLSIHQLSDVRATFLLSHFAILFQWIALDFHSTLDTHFHALLLLVLIYVLYYCHTESSTVFLSMP